MNLRLIPRQYKGPEEQLCPEELIPSVLASCILITFLEIKNIMGINLQKWESNARADVEPSPEQGFRIEKIEIHLKLKVSPEDKEKIPRAMELAHKYCLLSRAIKGNVEEIIDYEFIE